MSNNLRTWKKSPCSLVCYQPHEQVKSPAEVVA